MAITSWLKPLPRLAVVGVSPPWLHSLWLLLCSNSSSFPIAWGNDQNLLLSVFSGKLSHYLWTDFLIVWCATPKGSVGLLATKLPPTPPGNSFPWLNPFLPSHPAWKSSLMVLFLWTTTTKTPFSSFRLPAWSASASARHSRPHGVSFWPDFQDFLAMSPQSPNPHTSLAGTHLDLSLFQRLPHLLRALYHISLKCLSIPHLCLVQSYPCFMAQPHKPSWTSWLDVNFLSPDPPSNDFYLWGYWNILPSLTLLPIKLSPCRRQDSCLTHLLSWWVLRRCLAHFLYWQ